MATETALGRPLATCLRGTEVPYEAGLRWQHAAARALRAEDAGEALALIEHTPVYTAGPRTAATSVRVEATTLRAPLVATDRGGDVTWHGPGQLVGYPILDLRVRGLRPGDYVRALERVVVDALDAFDVAGGPVAGRPGVWVDGAKVAAIGVRVREGVSLHGFALNVAPDLRWFDDIVPCGIADVGVTSLARLLGAAPSMAAVVAAVRASFEATFEVSLGEDGWLEGVRA